jgi:two-component system response regulator HydG
VAKVRNSTFREDFFYRISTIVIRIPALKERKEDLVDMIHFFLEESQRVNQIRIDSIDEKAWDFLINYDYPGNIRELRNHVDRMVVLSKNHVITTEGIPILYNLKTTDDDSPSTAFTQAGIVPWREFKRRSEREYLQWVLNQMGWNISATAYKLGISARQLFNKINEYNLENPQTGRPQKPVHSI